MDKLQELVLSYAPEESLVPESLSPIEIISSRQPYSLDEAIELVRWARRSVSKDPSRAWECLSLVAAVSFRAPFRSSDTRRVLLLFRAREITYGDQSSLEEMLAALREEEKYLLQEQRRARRRSTVGSATQALDFLHDFWGEGFVEEASEVLGCRKETVRRWLQGGGISSDFAGKLLLWARAFYELPDGGEKEWWSSPLASGTTPRQYFCAGWSDSPPGMLRAALYEIDSANR